MSAPFGRNPTTAGQISAVRQRHRKVRKGTQSCWECKRRKIRCTFVSSTNSICDGCRSRRTTCISQKFHNEGESIARVSRRGSSVGEVFNRTGIDENLVEDTQSDVRKSDVNVIPSDAIRYPSPDLDIRNPTSWDEISGALLAAWPSKNDMEKILSIPVGISVLLHGVIFIPYSRLSNEYIDSPRLILMSQPQESHPVHLARRLLLLSTFLQNIPPCYAEELSSLSSDYHTIMSRAFKSATRLVTSDDEIVESVEGIECIMMESMFLNNAGNLRRAWLANRRAMTLAQSMGLHTGSTPKLISENETRNRIDPYYMWYRLVSSDRYLSLMLGLPQGIPENIFASPKALENCMDLERMERMESVAAGLILQLDRTERNNFAETYRIDQMLQEAAALMPSQWWQLVTDIPIIDGNDTKALEESIRLTNQIAHHHLLVQLHLPYMLLPASPGSNHDYSKMTAANASRAILTQFVSFHRSISSTAYCRGIDFVTFIASTTLCLAHIEARRNTTGVTVLQSLQHQRLSDRAALERTLDIMKELAQKYRDDVAQKMSYILQPLLGIEETSYKGESYYIYTSKEARKEDYISFGNQDQALHALRVHVPHVGTIHIENRSTGPNSNLEEICDPVSLPNQSTPLLDISGTEQDLFLSIPELSAVVGDWALQGVDVALFNNLTHNSMGATH